MSGLFITFEGTDGAGKTTQIELLEQYFKNKGFSVLCTREPGGTDISEKIREIIIDIENKKMKSMTEAFLYAASRVQLTEEIIMPALKDGMVVISDRFVDSSIVYQGMARDIGEDIILDINKYAVGELEPDITFYLKLDPLKGIDRKKKQEKLDRIESEKTYFHKKVFSGYEKLAAKFSQRIKSIDASADINCIHKIIVDYVERLLEDRSFL